MVTQRSIGSTPINAVGVIWRRKVENSFPIMKRYIKYIVLSGAVLLASLSPWNARAQDILDIAETAKQTTVRIEDATQGSGVLVKKKAILIRISLRGM